MDEVQLQAVSMATAAVLLALYASSVTRRAVDGRLARNHVYGIQLREVLASDLTWTLGHVAALPIARILPLLAFIGALATALALINAGESPLPMWTASLSLITQVVLIIEAVRRASRATKDAG